MFRLRILGGALLEGATGPITGRVAQRRRLALLACLALARGRPVSRDRLMALFWPDSDTEQARHLLSDSVYLIRKELGESALISVGEDLRLDATLVGSDVAEFEQALAAGESELAVSLYGGPLLDGVHVEAAPEFEQWLDGERQQLANAYAKALEAVAGGLEARGEYGGAVTWWRRLSAHEPASGRIAGRLMRALAASGDRAGALQHARAHAALLRGQFELDPDPEIRELCERLLLADNDIGTVPREQSPELLQPSVVPDQSIKVIQPARRGLKWKVVVASVAVVVAGLAWVTLGQARKKKAAPATPVYTVLADVEGTADIHTRRAVKRLLRSALELGNTLVPLGNDEVRRGLVTMLRPDSLPLDVDAARQVAFRGGVRTVVAAELDQVGQVFALTLRVVDADSGIVRATERRTSQNPDGLIPASDAAVRGLHRRLSGRRLDLTNLWPRRSASTKSFEAYRKYHRADDLNGVGRQPEAIELLREALAIDSTFASAWARLAGIWSNLGNQDSMLAAVRHLELHWERQTEWEQRRNRVEVAASRRQYRAALDAAERMLRDYARTPVNLNLKAVLLSWLGRPEEAIPLYREAVERSRFGPVPIHVTNLQGNLVRAGRVDEARKLIDSLRQTCGLDCIRALGPAWQQRIAVLLEEWEKAESLEVAVPDPLTRTALHSRRGEFTAGVAALAEVTQAPPGGNHRIGAIGELLFTLVTRRPWNRAPAFAGQDSLYRMTWNGIWDAIEGDTVKARRSATELRRALPAERGSAPEFIDAAVAARAERWREVVNQLGPKAFRHETGPQNGEAIVSVLPIRWLMATAYDRLGNPDSAAAMYELVLRPNSSSETYLVLRGIPYSFAHQRLVILYSRMGRVDDATKHWKIFEESFTNPDPEFRYLIDEAREALRQAKEGRN